MAGHRGSQLTFERVLLLTLVWGAVAFGAVYPWAYWPLAAVCALLGAWALAATKNRSSDEASGRDGLVVALGLTGAAIALQLVPLPLGIFARLAPAADRFLGLYDLGYIQQPSSWHPLTISPQATWTGLAWFAALALLFIGLTRIVAELKLDRFVSVLMTFGMGLAILGAAQKAIIPADDPLIYGFWKPHDKGSPFGPFVNRNHFAGWMLMVLPLAIGHARAVFEAARRPERGAGAGAWLRWLATPQASRFAFVVCAVFVMGTALVMTRSRSGLASFTLTLAVLAALMARRATRRATRWMVAAGAVAVVLGAVVWSGTADTVDRFSSASVDMAARLAAWQDTLRIIGDFPWFGTGVGTYGLAMLIYQTSFRETMFMQAHNDYLQLAAEGGLLLGVPVVIALVLIGRRVWTRLRHGVDDPRVRWIRIGAVAGLAGIAAQSLVEFSLQMPGNAALFVVLLAIALHQPIVRPLHPHAHRI